MSSNAIKTQGTTITWNGTSIGDVTAFDGPGGEAADIDVTDLSSTAMEYLAGLPDNGTFTLTCNFVPGDTGQTNLRTDRDSGTSRSCVITFTDTSSTTATFTAVCKGFSVSGSPNDKVVATITLRVSGSITWA